MSNSVITKFYAVQKFDCLRQIYFKNLEVSGSENYLNSK